MKCMPITRSGREVTEASLVIEIEEVFDARIAPAGSALSMPRKMAELDLEVLRRGLDREVAPWRGRPRPRRAGCGRAARPARPRGILPLSTSLPSAVAIWALPPSASAIVASHSVDLEPGRGRDLGDAPPHLPGADDPESCAWRKRPWRALIAEILRGKPRKIVAPGAPDRPFSLRNADAGPDGLDPGPAAPRTAGQARRACRATHATPRIPRSHAPSTQERPAASLETRSARSVHSGDRRR